MLTTTYPNFSLNTHNYNMYTQETLSHRQSFHDMLDFCSPKLQQLSPPQGAPTHVTTHTSYMTNQQLLKSSPSTMLSNANPSYIIPSQQPFQSQQQQEALLQPALSDSRSNSNNCRHNMMLEHEMRPSSYSPPSFSSPSLGLPMMGSSFDLVNNSMHSVFIPPSVGSQAQQPQPYQQQYCHSSAHHRVYSSPSASPLSLHQFRSVPDLSPLFNSSSYDINSPMLSRRCSLAALSRAPSPNEFVPSNHHQQSQRPSSPITAGNKKYVCPICDKRFTRPSSLTTHIYSHTGEKPFKCPIDSCGRSFSVVSNLRRHAKVHGMANFDNFNIDTPGYKTIRRTMSSSAITTNSAPFSTLI